MLSLHCMIPTRLVREGSDDTTTQSRSWTVGLQVSREANQPSTDFKACVRCGESCLLLHWAVLHCADFPLCQLCVIFSQGPEKQSKCRGFKLVVAKVFETCPYTVLTHKCVRSFHVSRRRRQRSSEKIRRRGWVKGWRTWGFFPEPHSTSAGTWKDHLASTSLLRFRVRTCSSQDTEEYVKEPGPPLQPRAHHTQHSVFHSLRLLGAIGARRSSHSSCQGL